MSGVAMSGTFESARFMADLAMANHYKHLADAEYHSASAVREREKAARYYAEAVALDPSRCHHCGSGPDPDGDHSCPCPHRDEDCPDHPLTATVSDV